jgi:hypothetical protein
MSFQICIDDAFDKEASEVKLLSWSQARGAVTLCLAGLMSKVAEKARCDMMRVSTTMAVPIPVRIASVRGAVGRQAVAFTVSVYHAHPHFSVICASNTSAM